MGAAAPPPPGAQQTPPQPAYQAPPAYQAAPPAGAYPQGPPLHQPPPQQPQARAYVRPRRSGLPTWLLTLLFAFAFVGLGAAIYWGVGYLRGGGGNLAAAKPAATVESPTAKPGAKPSALQKYMEISGVRFAEDAKKKLQVKFNLTNHSDADITGLTGNVTIWGRTQKSEEDAVGTFSFMTDVSPQSTRELTAPLTTKLKVYELPDWQNVTTDLQITAPQ
ncbi:MAG TPA: hypothetical protein VGF16_06875 [Bryobacteraceae bacterium]